MARALMPLLVTLTALLLGPAQRGLAECPEPDSGYTNGAGDPAGQVWLSGFSCNYGPGCRGTARLYVRPPCGIDYCPLEVFSQTLHFFCDGLETRLSVPGEDAVLAAAVTEAGDLDVLLADISRWRCVRVGEARYCFQGTPPPVLRLWRYDR